MFDSLRNFFKQRPPKYPLSLEQQVEFLAQHGLPLAAPFTVDDLLESFPREDYEDPQFDRLLLALASAEEQPPWRRRCPAAWHLDTECIEDHGAYAEIAKQMADITGGGLVITNVSDYVDVDVEVAWLEFDFLGRRVHMDLAVDNDWLDGSLFEKFCNLLSESAPSKIYLSQVLGQDLIVVCVEKEQAAALREAGVPLEPLP